MKCQTPLPLWADPAAWLGVGEGVHNDDDDHTKHDCVGPRLHRDQPEKVPFIFSPLNFHFCLAAAFFV